VCAHCRLDERWLAWELRLFSLQSRALAAGAAVSAADALRQVSDISPYTPLLVLCARLTGTPAQLVQAADPRGMVHAPRRAACLLVAC